ncbi:MAG TPA: hypothetical protein VMW32_10550 [Bacteroidales bacterium]|nr:hypothetical protein [Bacteroidales bacterium]
MKRITFFIFLVVAVIASTFSASGQKDIFSGTWKIDRSKSTLSEYIPTLATITININGDSLLTARVYEGGDGQEYPFTENLTLDGKEYKITIYDMPRKSKATWSEKEGAVIVESTTTYYDSGTPADFVSKETWKVDKANNILTISFINKMSTEEMNGALIFNKAEQVK